MRFWISGPRIFGLRPGVSFAPKDFQQAKLVRPQEPARMTGGFIYVIRGDHGLLKIGISTNPSARIAQLRTASPFPLDFEYIGAMNGFGENVEREAHATLEKYRTNGEWFDCSPEMAVAAVSAAAYRLGEPIASVRQEQVPQIIKLCQQDDRNSPSPQPPNRSLGFLGWLAVFAKTIVSSSFLMISLVVLLVIFPVDQKNPSQELQTTIGITGLLIPVVSMIAAYWDTKRRRSAH